ncbi:MAG: hypothetical protein R3244_00425 [Thermoanaerobaculia bacterium]|nr:hypothetical protein [Thermoanaerobaculia bacterium]
MTTDRPTVLTSTALLALALTAGGCTTGARLTPAPGASEGARVAEETVIDRIDGVEMTIEVDAWPGSPAVEREVTPIQISIDNDSQRPVRFAYQNLALVTDRGERLSALPIFRAERKASDAVEPPVTTIGFHHRRFTVAPHLHAYFPSLTLSHHHFPYDPLYNTHYYDFWLEGRIEMAQVRLHGLPEGVLEPDGEISGFVFFEKVDPEIDRVRLRADLVDADSGEVFGSLSIPFEVVEKG